jgi:hypothetical protein
VSGLRNVGFGPIPMPWERKRQEKATAEARKLLELAARPTDLGPMGEAAPVKGVRRRGPNVLVVVGWLFVAAVIIQIIVEVTL